MIGEMPFEWPPVADAPRPAPLDVQLTFRQNLSAALARQFQRWAERVDADIIAALTDAP